MAFNSKSRTENALKSSTMAIIEVVSNSLLSFIYRTLFIRFLSSTYLGLNGLFSNVIGLLSIAELGIGMCIKFRLYKPMGDHDVEKAGQIAGFLRRVYLIISLVILILGIIILPFAKSFIKNPEEIPSDVNVYIIYLLFLFESFASYLFTFRFSVFSADQKDYLYSFYRVGGMTLKYVIQMIILITTRNYTLVLASGIITFLIADIVFSNWIKNQYKEIFAVKTPLSKGERREIMDDTKATLLHRIGGKVLDSSDTILTSKLIGLTITGFYANYYMVSAVISKAINSVMGSFVSSLGNAHYKMTTDERLWLFKRLLFANLWLGSMFSVCFFVLIDDFINIWAGPGMLLDGFTVLCISIKLYLSSNRVILGSFIDGCGLFVKDRYRSLIEAVFNIVFSLLLARRFGLAGIFLGTLASIALTEFWREPYLLYKYEFKHKSISYWLTYAGFAALAVISTLIIRLIFNSLSLETSNLITWIIKGVIAVVVFNAIHTVTLFPTKEFKFYTNLIGNKFRKKA